MKLHQNSNQSQRTPNLQVVQFCTSKTVSSTRKESLTVRLQVYYQLTLSHFSSLMPYFSSNIVKFSFFKGLSGKMRSFPCDGDNNGVIKGTIKTSQYIKVVARTRLIAGQVKLKSKSPRRW